MTCFFETHGTVLKILKIFVPLPDVADSSEFTSHYPLHYNWLLLFLLCLYGNHVFASFSLLHQEARPYDCTYTHINPLKPSEYMML